MPYQWTTQPSAPEQELELWPHESLPARGMAAFVLTTFTLILIPTVPLLGSPILWGLLPFLLGAVWAIYFALQHNHKSRQIREILHLDATEARLERTNPGGERQTWKANRYWTQVTKYASEGPVPHYVTLKGNGREVEIGAFLSEEERAALYVDLCEKLKAH